MLWSGHALARAPLALILAVTLSACGGGGSTTVTVKLDDDPAKARPLSHVEGKMTLTDVGDGTVRVVLETSLGSPEKNLDMPANIHQGHCPDVGPVAYPLANVKNGKSSTDIKADFKQLISGGYAVNLQKSPQQTDVWVACADIKVAQ